MPKEPVNVRLMEFKRLRDRPECRQTLINKCHDRSLEGSHRYGTGPWYVNLPKYDEAQSKQLAEVNPAKTAFDKKTNAILAQFR